jgi:hypothetical protein
VGLEVTDFHVAEDSAGMNREADVECSSAVADVDSVRKMVVVENGLLRSSGTTRSTSYATAVGEDNATASNRDVSRVTFAEPSSTQEGSSVLCVIASGVTKVNKSRTQCWRASLDVVVYTEPRASPPAGKAVSPESAVKAALLRAGLLNSRVTGTGAEITAAEPDMPIKMANRKPTTIMGGIQESVKRVGNNGGKKEGASDPSAVGLGFMHFAEGLTELHS